MGGWNSEIYDNGNLRVRQQIRHGASLGDVKLLCPRFRPRLVYIRARGEVERLPLRHVRTLSRTDIAAADNPNITSCLSRLQVIAAVGPFAA